MDYFHEPVLLSEVLEGLNPKADDCFIDGTLGGAGHAQKILEKIGPTGVLIGFDRDPKSIKTAAERLSAFKNRVILIQDSYWNLKSYYESGKLKDSPKGILLDLGLSSEQLTAGDNRGFSFQTDQPLDMRFGPDSSLTAADLLNRSTEEELFRIIKDYGEEPKARLITRKIVSARKEKSIKTTFDLVEIVKGCYKGRSFFKINPATRTFQAIRIAVNDELSGLSKTLPDLVEILPSGGRLAVISFHSLEDRIVKQFFKSESIGCICPKNFPECRCGHKAKVKILTKKPVMASATEIKNNPRSRSAKLRVVEKI